MMKLRIIYLILLLASMLGVRAQKLTVESMKATNDLSASQHRRNDLTGKPCALIKVQLATSGATFEGNYIPPVEYKSGEYWVYMSEGSRELRIKHPSFVPLHVKFADYGIKDVQSLITYDLTVIMPNAHNDEIMTLTVNGVSFNMIRVDGGVFDMGESGNEYCNLHKVTLSSYFIGETEVTQELWYTVMGNNPSSIKGLNFPVESVSWDDCRKFIRKLNDKMGCRFRLPTEAEWEYAARGGNKSKGFKYSGGNTIDVVAWYKDNSEGTIHAVKTKQANELGLYDMSGNVAEWCQDWYSFHYDSNAQFNPIGPKSGVSRVFRGSSIDSGVENCKLTLRGNFAPKYRFEDVGLRLALKPY